MYRGDVMVYWWLRRTGEQNIAVNKAGDWRGSYHKLCNMLLNTVTLHLGLNKHFRTLKKCYLIADLLIVSANEKY